jgi:hypothetical protein
LSAGVETLAAGLGSWLAITISAIRDERRIPLEYSGFFPIRAIIAQLATLPAIVAGAILAIGSWNGLYLIPAALIFTYPLAIYNG